jgi:TonB-dependent receptor
MAQDDQPEEELVLEEVIVTGMRQTQESAQNIKMNSETIVDSIVADDIANLPDRSVTETLQRIPGVTIDRFISRGDPEHFGGEGSGVAVRGMTQVRGEINGRDGFTANGGRSLSLKTFPELLAGVDVYKNATADMIEGGLGGTVNLRTRMPLQIDEQLIAFTATANYNNFIEETTPGFSAMYSGRWDTSIGEMGFLVDLAYSELKGRIDVLFSRPYFPRNDTIGSGDYGIPGQTGTVWAPRGADWRTERRIVSARAPTLRSNGVRTTTRSISPRCSAASTTSPGTRTPCSSTTIPTAFSRQPDRTVRIPATGPSTATAYSRAAP